MGNTRSTQDTSARPVGSADLSDVAVGADFERAAIAKSYPSLYREDSALGELFRTRVLLVHELLAAERGGRLLDAGCGAGQMTRYLLDHRPGAFSITALDRSHAMIDEARATIGGRSGVEFVVDRIESMPFEDGQFDVALALGVLEYVTDVEAAVAELGRVVRPGGLVVASMQNRWGPWRVWDTVVFRLLRRLHGSIDAGEYQERPVDERPLRRILERSGLTPVDVVYYNFNLFFEPLDEWFPHRARRMTRRLASLGRGPLRRLGSDLLVAARKEAPPGRRVGA